jgi:hypothetical protein
MKKNKEFTWNSLTLKIRNRLPSQAVAMNRDIKRESITKNQNLPSWLNMGSSASISAS